MVVPDEGNVRLWGIRTMASIQTDERASAILARRARGLLAHDEALAELANADCGAAIVDTIAERLCIRADLVRRAIDAEDDKAVSVMCRAAGFNTESYSALLRMRRRHNRGSGSAPVLALTFFSVLSRLSAERMLPRVAAELGREG